MPRLMYAVFAERVVIDRVTNHIFVQNVLEQITVPHPPEDVLVNVRKRKRAIGARGRMTLLVHWRREDLQKPEGRLETKVELIGPNKKVLAKATQDLDLRTHGFVRNLVEFETLPIVGQGTYSARISVRLGGVWKRVGEASFGLIFQPNVPVGGKDAVH